MDLASGDLDAARGARRLMVSRQTTDLDAAGVAGACIESDSRETRATAALALFWFALLGGGRRCCSDWRSSTRCGVPPTGACRFRLGRCARGRDDLLHDVPARLTALSYALGRPRARCPSCWRQAPRWKEPERRSPVIAAGAGLAVLGPRVGGAAQSQFATGDAACSAARPAAGRSVRASADLVRGSLSSAVVGGAAAAGGWPLLEHGGRGRRGRPMGLAKATWRTGWTSRQAPTRARIGASGDRPRLAGGAFPKTTITAWTTWPLATTAAHRLLALPGSQAASSALALKRSGRWSRPPDT
ncbi:MAG: cobalamin biosynthesis protein [Candidatus Accumulibacter sp.]|nr:cobalamin biosynthesis protein [Accumulibacter sp.]